MKRTIKTLIAIFCVALVFSSFINAYALEFTEKDGSPWQKVGYMLQECITSNRNDSFDVHRFKYTNAAGNTEYAFSLTLPFDDCDFYDGDSDNQGYIVIDSQGNYYFQEISHGNNPQMTRCIPITITIHTYYMDYGNGNSNTGDSPDKPGAKYYWI